MLAICIFTLFSVSVVYLSLDTASRATQVEVKNEGLLYAEEGMEAVRNIRDRDYFDLVTGEYGLSLSSDTWAFVTAPEVIDGYYERTVSIDDVYRDGSGNIADVGVLDIETKKVTVTVTWDWKEFAPKQASVSSYFTNWTGDEWMQTTCTEISAGTFGSTEAQATASPPATNCAVELIYTEGQSDFFCSIGAGSHGTDVIISGNYVYFTTGNTNDGLMIAELSSLGDCEEEGDFDVEELDVGGKGRYLAKYGNYLYIGVQHSSRGLAVVDVTDPENPSLVRQINVGGYGNQPFVSGSTLLMGVEKSSGSLVAYNLATPSNPSLLGSYNSGSATRAVEVTGSYALIGIDNSASSLRVINISDPAAMTQSASLNVSAKINALDYYSSVLYAGTDSSSSSLKVINLSNPLSPVLSTSVNVGSNILDLKVESAYLYAPMDTTNNALAVLNVSSPLSPVVTYYADIGGKGTGVDSDVDNVFLSTDTSNEGLVIRETVNVALASPGTYTSGVLDTGSADTRFNFIEWTATVPLTGSVSFKIRTANSVANLNTATWVGSAGTAGSSYTASPTNIVLDPLRTGTRYAQIQMTLTSDGVSTPSVESFSLNFNP